MKKILNDYRFSYLWLFIGAILLLFSNGKWVVSIVPWFSMIFILRFLRTQKPLKGIVIGAAVNIAVSLIIHRGIIPLNGVLYYVVVGSMGLSSFLPYIVDRILASRVKTYAAAFVFPFTWVSLEYINSLFNPYGTWSSIAYTQYGNLPLMQLLSVTGIWGIVFLMPWFAATVNWAWNNGFEWMKVKKGVIAFAAVFVAIMAFGGARMAFFKPAAETVCAATFAVPYDITEKITNVNPQKILSENPDGFRDIMLKETESLPDIMFSKTEQAALSGAKIVAWSEGALYIGKEKEEEITERACKLAAEQKIYLLMALSVIPKDFPERLLENKVVWISPSGVVLGEYMKSRPVPGEPCVRGNGKPLILDTQYGRISSMICFDMDFPSLVRNITNGGVDILFCPSADWKEIDPLHTHMIMFRAVENGFSMARITSKGLSGAYDYQGRTLSSSDYFSEKDKVMISNLPVKGTTTIYSRLGDFAAWLSIAGLILVFISSRKRT